MRLPNAHRAVVDLAKLRDYCLSTEHPRGRNKARVFASSLGLTARDAEWLRRQFLAAARTEEATFAGADEYGERYRLDVPLATSAGTAVVCTAWIIRAGERAPRLTSCYVL